MRAVIERRRTRSAAWSRRFASFSVALLLLSGLCHRYGLLETLPFFWVLGVVFVCAAFAIMMGVYAFTRLWHYGDLGGWDLTVGSMTGLAVLAPFMLFAYWGATLPMLSDVSTDTDDPPAMVLAATARTPEMNPILPITAEHALMQVAAYPTVTGRRYTLPLDVTVDAVSAVVKAKGWPLLSGAEAPDGAQQAIVEALAHTLVLAFPVDVAIRVTDEGGTSYVDMRSNSRYGLYDFGDNAARITAFLADLDMQTAGLAGTVPPAQ